VRNCTRSCSLVASLVCLLLLILAVGCGGNLSTATVGSASPSPTPVASPSPTPSGSPSNTTVLSDVEDSPDWLTCGACGNTGGTGAVPGFAITPGMASPSEDGSSTQFAIAPTAAFNNVYFFRQQKAIPHQINALTYAFDLYIPAGMESVPQAIEFECQQIVDGWVYNFSWQADYPVNQWRIFDYGLKRWDSTPLNFTHFTPGTWHHIVAEYHNDRPYRNP
jgi:hypothetical protein